MVADRLSLTGAGSLPVRGLRGGGRGSHCETKLQVDH